MKNLKQVSEDIAFNDRLRFIASNIDDAMDQLFNELDKYEENERAELIYKYVIEYGALSWLWDKQNELKKSKK